MSGWRGSGSWSGYRSFLSLAGVPRLLVSAVVSRTPVGMLPLSILLLTREQTRSFASAGVAVAGFGVASAAGSPVLGALVARQGQRRVLVGCALCQGITLVALVLVAKANADAVWLALLSGLAGATLPPTMACARTIWAEVVPDAQTRDSAFALDAISTEVAWVVGPLLVLATVALATPATAVLLSVALTVGGVTAFVGSPLTRRQAHAEVPFWSAALPNRAVRKLLTSVTLIGVWWGGLQVGLPALAIHAGADWAAGLLLAIVSAGSVCGGLFYGSRVWSAPLTVRYPALLLALALLSSPLIALHGLASAVLLSALAGAAMAPMMSLQNALTMLATTRGERTPAFTWSTSAAFAGVAVGASIAGTLVEDVGIGAPFALGALAAMLGAAVAWNDHRRGARRELGEVPG